MPAARAARGGHHGTRSSGSTRAVEDGHRRRGGGNRGRARVARAGPGGEVVGGDGGAEAEGARQRHRLPPSHLRRASTRSIRRRRCGPRTRSSRTTARCRSASAPPATCIVQPSTYGIDNRCTPRRAGGVRPDRAGVVAVVNDTVTGRGAQAHARDGRPRHPLQPGPGRRHHAGDDGAALQAGRTRSAGTSRSTRRRPRSWRSCRSSSACRRRSCSITSPTSRSPPASTTRSTPRSWR